MIQPEELTVEVGVTKTRFAELIKAHKSQPTRWAKRGMPVRDDGLVPAIRAFEWAKHNIDPIRRYGRGSTYGFELSPEFLALISAAAGVGSTLYHIPTTVTLAVAASEGDRQTAERAAEVALMIAVEDAKLPEGDLLLDSEILEWRDRVDWANLFDDEGNSKLKWSDFKIKNVDE